MSGTGWCGWVFLCWFFILVLNPALVGIIRFYKGVPVDWVQVFLHNHCPGPMWFVLTLLVFELLYVVYRSCRKTVPKISAATKLPSVWTVVAFIVVMGLVAFAIRLVCPAGEELVRVAIRIFPLYVGMFCAGIVAWRDGWLERMQVRNALGWFGLAWGAIVAFVAFYFVNRSSGDSGFGRLEPDGFCLCHVGADSVSGFRIFCWQHSNAGGMRPTGSSGLWPPIVT